MTVTLPSLPHFADLKPAEKRYWIEIALSHILAELPGPAPTIVISGLVARALGCKPEEVGGTVLKLAYDHSAARQDGAKFKRYGRTMTGWRWYPTDDTAAEPITPLIPPVETAKALPHNAVLCDDGVIRSMKEMLKDWQ
jgi:hypothetical protein